MTHDQQEKIVTWFRMAMRGSINGSDTGRTLDSPFIVKDLVSDDERKAYRFGIELGEEIYRRERAEAAKSMNPIQLLKANLSHRYPDVGKSLERPDELSDDWYLSLYFHSKRPPIVVAWEPAGVFDICPSRGSGDVGPGERFPELDSAFARLCELVEAEGIEPRKDEANA